MQQDAPHWALQEAVDEAESGARLVLQAGYLARLDIVVESPLGYKFALCHGKWPLGIGIQAVSTPAITNVISLT
jgi:hypothetical protein